MSAEFAPGDRVKVTVEGEVQRAFDSGALWLSGPLGTTVDPAHIASVEKVEPPVETFQPGDVVRHKSEGKTYAIVEGGFIPLHSKNDEKGTRNHLDYPFVFTSEHYEKVELDD